MTTLIDHDHLRTRNVFVETLADGQRYEPVLASPKNQRRPPNRFYRFIDKVFATQDRLGDAVDRVAVSGSKPGSDRLINGGVGQKCLVVENFRSEEFHAFSCRRVQSKKSTCIQIF